MNSRPGCGAGGGVDHYALREELGGPVDRYRVDCLVGRDEDEAPDSRLERRGDEIARAEDVVVDRRDRILLHHGDVLVGGGVEERFRLQPPEYEAHVVGILQVADERDDRGLLPYAFFAEEPELAVDLIDGILPVAEEVEPRDARGKELAGELRADRAAGPGDEDALPPEVGETLLQSDGHRAAAEEILALDLPRLDEVRVSLDDLGDAGDYPHADEARALQEEMELPEEFLRRARDGDDGLVGGRPPQEVDDVPDRAEHGNALYLAADLGGIVVEEGDDRAEDDLVPYFAGDGPAREARSDYVDPTAVALRIPHRQHRLRP